MGMCDIISFEKFEVYGGVNMVLLVVDTQKAITNSGLYQFELFETNVKELIHKARQNDIEVIFVRHDDGVGNELTKGNEGFEIYEGFQPMDDEVIFDKNVDKNVSVLACMIAKRYIFAAEIRQNVRLIKDIFLILLVLVLIQLVYTMLIKS